VKGCRSSRSRCGHANLLTARDAGNRLHGHLASKSPARKAARTAGGDETVGHPQIDRSPFRKPLRSRKRITFDDEKH
jgi:hypothetical protein